MEKLPKDARIHQQSKDLISELCMYFLMNLAEQANEVCSAQKKKTVCPDHVLDALAKMNLTRYYAQMTGDDTSQQAQEAKPEPKTRKKGIAKSQMTPGNDIKSLRNAIMARLNQSMDTGFKMGRSGRSRVDRNNRHDDGLTDEQRNIEQEKLFEDARLRYNAQQEQMALDAAKSGQNPSQQPQQQAQPGDFYEGFEGQADGDALMEATPMDMAGDEAYYPPYNPTDYIRDQIFNTDFMNDHDMPEENQAMVPGHANSAQVEDSALEREKAPEESFVLESGFAFDEEDLLELKAASNAVEKKGAAVSREASAGKAKAGSSTKDYDTKPKEQNDQDMEEETKQPSK